MSKAGLARRKKLLYNIFKSKGVSGSDKMVYYAMHLRYIDGIQLLEFLETYPTISQIKEYVEARLKENHISNE